ncbi:MAG TPA: hypothetical protein ENJ06_01175 [Phycisphaeraceae bacterium]|nr:hypothetical protein [Phycisphaeraceae bacterium]
MELAWGVSLFAVAVLLFVLELFVPSGGIIGVVAAICALAGCVAFFQYSPQAGLIASISLAIVAPVGIWGAFKIYPHTPVGRRMILGTPPGEEDEAARRRIEQKLAEEEKARQIIGAEGVTVTDLHPVGVVRIEGERMQALAESGIIEANTRVKVIAVEGTELKVRAIG